MNKTFILHEQVHVNNMQAFIAQNWQACAKDVPLQVRITPYRRSRSLEQNSMYWALLSDIAEQAYVNGQRFEADTWHEHFKRLCLPETCAKDVDKWKVIPSGDRALMMSTTDLNTKEMSEYVEAVTAYAATELGVEFK
jgi:hypothetical protein